MYRLTKLISLVACKRFPLLVLVITTKEHAHCSLLHLSYIFIVMFTPNKNKIIYGGFC